MELRHVAAEALGRPKLRDAGLKALTREVTGAHIDKPKRLTMSKWDELRLTVEQVRYACIDAFVCYEIGRLLLTGECAEGAAAISPSPLVASAVPVA